MAGKGVAGLRRLDAFKKTRPDLNEKSTAGGVITVLASSITAALFVSQVVVYILGSPEQHLRLAVSHPAPMVHIPGSHAKPDIREHGERMLLSIYITFPHMSCDMLDVVHDGAYLSTGELDKVHGRHSVRLRKPSPAELIQFGFDRSTSHRHQEGGCTVEGSLRPHLVGGTLSVGMNRMAWSEATNALAHMMQGNSSESMTQELKRFNVSHYIHDLVFMQPFLLAERPLEKRAHIVNNDYGGVAVEHIQVKLVRTSYQNLLIGTQGYQASVVTHTVLPQTLVNKGVPYLPGLVMVYDFMPLSVYQTAGRDNFLVFLSSLVSIVGGVFVTLNLVSGCILHSARAFGKKED